MARGGGRAPAPGPGLPRRRVRAPGRLVPMADGRATGTAVLRAPRGRPLALSAGVLTAWVSVSAALGYLVARVAPDVHGKPLFEDEAVAGPRPPPPPWGLLGTG